MKEDYIELRCPNRPRKDDEAWECRSMLAGVSLSTLLAHDWKKPFKDMRYCHHCGHWEITIESMQSVPVFKKIDVEKDGKIRFIPFKDIFSIFEVDGRKLKKQS